MSLVYKTTFLSLCVQIIIGIFDVIALTYSVPEDHRILKSVLLIETIVQVVELCFYIYFVLRFSLGHMATSRYFDWFLTTPLMLFTTIVFLEYQARREADIPSNFTLASFIKDNRANIGIILSFNFAMLLVGYLAETNVIPRHVAALLGFAFLVVSFTTIFNNFARRSVLGRKLFIFLAIVWGLYGVAFLLPTVEKNIAYNCLDIVAKNFFGLYLFFKINAVQYQKN